MKKKIFAYVYILRCADRSLYTGSAKNPFSRLQQHQSGRGAKYVRARLPVELVYLELWSNWGATLSREAQIKKLNRSGKEALIAAAALVG